MQSLRRLKICKLLSLLWLLTTALPPLSSACATATVHDSPWYSPLPGPQYFGQYGAVGDNFLTHNPNTLDGPGWLAWENAQVAAGYAIECTNSQTLADLKADVEQLCSVARCDYETLMAKEILRVALDKTAKLGVHE